MNDKFRCGRFVTSRIHRIIGDHPGSLNPNGRAMLAQLRQAIGKEPGTVPTVWPITLEGLPEFGGRTQTRVETAVHTALTLFALHQQSQPASMHSTNVSFGSAVRALAEHTAGPDGPHSSPAYRRFTALCTTTDIQALLVHARGLITQMRSHSIPFDYGRFADDLFFFQIPGHAASIQRTWGRQFHRLSTANAGNTTREGAPE